MFSTLFERSAARLMLVPVLLVLAAIPEFSVARAADAGKKPNIIFVLTDDFGRGDVGVYFQNERRAAGDRSRPWQYTPNLDRLAAEGALLHDHYCPAPVCAPSRASLMLGVTQGHANIRDNQFDKALENNHTIASVLDQAGYETIAVGKWGLQGNAAGMTNPVTWPGYPTKRGFDYFFGYARHKDGHEHYPKEGLYDGHKQVWDGTNEISVDLDKCYTADLWTAWTKQWIVNHEQTNSARPFFIYLAYDTPHAFTEYPSTAYPAGGGLHGGLQWLGTPHHMINTADGAVDTYCDPLYATNTWDDDRNPATPEVAWPELAKRYATSTKRIDDAVGDLLQLLNDLNIDSNTMVIFSSDNGPYAGSVEEPKFLGGSPSDFLPTFFASYGNLDGIKRDCWEGGVRVPGLVRWPGHIAAGTVVTRPSALYDWLPTFAEMAGLPAPARADGVSMLPELTGRSGQRDRGYVYVEYNEVHRTPSYPDFAPSHRGRLRNQMQVIRMGDYLGVRYNIRSQADDFEVYQVPVDPQETNNLAAQDPAREKLMKDRVLQVRRPNRSAPRPYDNELVPADWAWGTLALPGMEWKAYDGDFPWVPDFGALGSVANGTAGDLASAMRATSGHAGMLLSGYLKIPADGDYTFHLSTDTGALLRIHDATVIDADYGYVKGRTVSGSIRLRAGLHSFRLFYLHNGGGDRSLALSWSGPGIPEQPVPEGLFGRSFMP